MWWLGLAGVIVVFGILMWGIGIEVWSGQW